MHAKSSERRSVPRLTQKLPILVWGAGQPELIGFTRDVSSTSVSFFVPSWPHASEMVELFLLLPPSSTSLAYEVGLSCHGRAIRVEEPRADGMIGVAAEIEDLRLRTMRLDQPTWACARNLWARLRRTYNFGLQQLRRVRQAVGRRHSPETALSMAGDLFEPIDLDTLVAMVKAACKMKPLSAGAGVADTPSEQELIQLRELLLQVVEDSKDSGTASLAIAVAAAIDEVLVERKQSG